MKTVALALSTLVALSGVAMAAGPNARNERPENTVPQVQVEKVEVKAGSIYSPRHLSREGLKADTSVTVTKIPSSGHIDRR